MILSSVRSVIVGEAGFTRLHAVGEIVSENPRVRIIADFGHQVFATGLLAGYLDLTAEFVLHYLVIARKGIAA